MLSEDFELELIPSAIPTEKSIAEEETKKLKKTEERLKTKFTCPNCHNILENPILKSMKRNVTLALKVCLYSHVVELNV